MEHLLFVYGTLRKGEKNHYLIRKAACVEENVYIRASMYDTGNGYPAIILDETETIVGELYQIDDDMLQIVDRLEGYRVGRSGNLYERIEVEVFAEHQTYQAIVYIAGASMNELSAHISSGDWVRYRKQSM